MKGKVKKANSQIKQQIWGEDKEHNRNTEWFEEVKGEMEDIPQQERVVITSGRMKKILNKMSNWKAPCPDGVQGYWLKNFRSIPEVGSKLLDQLFR